MKLYFGFVFGLHIWFVWNLFSSFRIRSDSRSISEDDGTELKAPCGGEHDETRAGTSVALSQNVGIGIESCRELWNFERKSKQHSQAGMAFHIRSLIFATSINHQHQLASSQNRLLVSLSRTHSSLHYNTPDPLSTCPSHQQHQHKAIASSRNPP